MDRIEARWCKKMIGTVCWNGMVRVERPMNVALIARKLGRAMLAGLTLSLRERRSTYITVNLWQ